MSLKVYLSPSNQDNNPYSYGGTNEMAQCNRIAEVAEKYLLRNGFEVKRAPAGRICTRAYRRAMAMELTYISVCTPTRAAATDARSTHTQEQPGN